ncbi:MAG: hypothetical protein ACI80V_001450 [Rhodothermales bacterium]|jgi:hypothetical protein
MEKKLQLIEHLYDEPSPDTEPLRELLGDPDLASEYQALSQARFVLDHRERVRPGPGVIDAIVRQAAAPTSRLGPGADRPPFRRISLRRRSVFAGLAMAAALALTVMVRPWALLSGTDAVPTVADNPFDFAVPAESLLRALPPAALPALSSQASSTPDWDSGDDLRSMSRRIQALQASGELAWDEPAIPLEMLPSGRSSGFTPVGSRR